MLRLNQRIKAAAGLAAIMLLAGFGWRHRSYRLEMTTHLGGAILGPVAVSGERAYVVMGNTLAVLDVSDPAQPKLIGRTESPLATNVLGGSPLSIKLHAGAAYVLTERFSKLWTVDVADPTNPRVLDTSLNIQHARAMAMGGDRLYIVDRISSGRGSLHIIDISEPLSPTVLTRADIAGMAVDIAVGESHLYVAGGTTDGPRSIWVYDLTAGPPALVGTWAMPATFPSREGTIQRVLTAEPYVYAVTSAGDVHVLDVRSPDEPSLLATLRPHTADKVIERPAWRGWNGDLADAALAGGRLFVLDNVHFQLLSVDITRPDSPRVIGRRVSEAGEKRLSAAGDRLFTSATCSMDEIGCMARGGRWLREYGTTGAGAPELIGAYSSFVPDDVVVAGNRAYIATGEQRLQVFDTSDPAGPKPIGATGPAGAARILLLSPPKALVGTGLRFDQSLDRLWHGDLSVTDAPWQVVLEARDHGWGSFHVLAASGTLVVLSASPRDGTALSALAESARSAYLIDVRDPGHPAMSGKLTGLSNPVAAALYREHAYVLAERDHATGGLGPQNDGGDATAGVTRYLFDIDLNQPQPYVPVSRTALGDVDDGLFVLPDAPYLVLHGSTEESLGILGLPLSARPDPRVVKITDHTRDESSADVLQLDAVGPMAFAIGSRFRAMLLDLSDLDQPVALFSSLTARGLRVRAIDGTSAFVFSPDGGLYALRIRRGPLWIENLLGAP